MRRSGSRDRRVRKSHVAMSNERCIFDFKEVVAYLSPDVGGTLGQEKMGARGKEKRNQLESGHGRAEGRVHDFELLDLAMPEACPP